MPLARISCGKGRLRRDVGGKLTPKHQFRCGAYLRAKQRAWLSDIALLARLREPRKRGHSRPSPATQAWK